MPAPSRYANPLDRQIDAAVSDQLPALDRLESVYHRVRGLGRSLVAKRAGLDGEHLRVFAKPDTDKDVHGEELPSVMPTHPDCRDAPLDTETTRLVNLSARLAPEIERLESMAAQAVEGLEVALALDAAGWPGGLCKDCRDWWPPGTMGTVGGMCGSGQHPTSQNSTCEWWVEKAQSGVGKD